MMNGNTQTSSSPTSAPNKKGSNLLTFLKKKKLLLLIVIASCSVLWWGVFSGAEYKAIESTIPTFTVTKSDLIVDVLEPGSIDSAESQTIRSQVEGKTTIISIVPEGTTITPKDVEEKKILLQLDSANLREKKTQQEITNQSARAKLTEASESLIIQQKLNESALKAGELKMKFALMDLEKYLGAQVAHVYLKQDIPFNNMIEDASLAGEALQKRRELGNTKLLEEIQKRLAEDKLEWTTKLEKKGFVSTNDLEVDRLAVEKSKVAMDKAGTAISLFRDYEFQKQAEKLKSDYLEAVRDLDRIVAKNRSELAKAEAVLASASATYRSQSDQLEKIKTQIENCTVYATQPGLIVYAGSSDDFRRSDRQIIEGAEVYERQEIIKIPNTTSMIAKAKVHESVIARIKEGQKALVKVDATNQEFQGTVKKVGILPDSQNRWMAPDIKVYQTDVALTEAPADLKPGMSTQVRIIINELQGVLTVPVQCVESKGDESYCYVLKANTPEKQHVIVGDYNDTFVEIKEGLTEGDQVAMVIPSYSDKGEFGKPSINGKNGSEEVASENPESAKPADDAGPPAPGGDRPPREPGAPGGDRPPAGMNGNPNMPPGPPPEGAPGGINVPREPGAPGAPGGPEGQRGPGRRREGAPRGERGNRESSNGAPGNPDRGSS
jgi:HlyD family secretion protein